MFTQRLDPGIGFIDQMFRCRKLLRRENGCPGNAVIRRQYIKDRIEIGPDCLHKRNNLALWHGVVPDLTIVGVADRGIRDLVRCRDRRIPGVRVYLIDKIGQVIDETVQDVKDPFLVIPS